MPPPVETTRLSMRVRRAAVPLPHLPAEVVLIRVHGFRLRVDSLSGLVPRPNTRQRAVKRSPCRGVEKRIARIPANAVQAALAPDRSHLCASATSANMAHQF